MRRQYWIFSGSLAVAFASLGLWSWLQPVEPTYHGRKLTAWLGSHSVWSGGSVIDLVPLEPPVEEALRQIGTNATPTLLKLMSRPDPPKWIDKLAELMERQDRIKIDWRWWAPYERFGEAVCAFRVLGPAVSNSAPAIIKVYRKDFGLSSHWACLESLAGIGEASPLVIPFLVSVATNKNDIDHDSAIGLLGHLHQRPDLVVPPLIVLLNDPSATADKRTVASALSMFGPYARPSVPALLNLIHPDATDTGAKSMNIRIIKMLGRIQCDAEVVVPIIRQCLEDQDEIHQTTMIKALCAFGAQAESTIPYLRTRLTSTNNEVRTAAEEAISQITFESAQNRK